MQKAHEPTHLPPTTQVVIEVPRGSFIKRDAHGQIDLLSPIPAPFNYGRSPEHHGGDGEPQDVVVLGPRLPRGHTTTLRVWGQVRFIDGGQPDHKWVCAAAAPSRRQQALLRGFFGVYAAIKQARDVLRARAPRSRFEGWHPAPKT